MHACEGSDAFGSTEPSVEVPANLPGNPWDHYIVKDLKYGYRCLKCSKVGYVANIREQGCKIPKPDTSPRPTSSVDVASIGASAAVVGSELCNQRVSQEDLQKEMEALEALERELRIQVQTQEILEAQEAQELAELEEQMRELELYETEEQQLERALKESLEEATAAMEVEEAKPKEELVPQQAPPGSANPPTEAASRPKRLRPMADESLPEASPSVPPNGSATEPPAKRPATSAPADDGVAAPVHEDVEDLWIRKRYIQYWSKFKKVAKPQQQVTAHPEVCNLTTFSMTIYRFSMSFPMCLVCAIATRV